MNTKKKYASPVAMRTALEKRLNRMARETNQDIMRLRRQIAFDRFLTRLFSLQQSDYFVLKGGYSIELKLQNARTTKDIDISVDDRKMGIVNNDKKLRQLIQAAAKINLNDYFEYTVGESTLDLENAVYCGFRFPIDCRMAGRRFVQFHIDVAAGDVWLNTHEKVSGHEWLEFAGITTPEFSVISSEQQFAEKLHSYSLPRQTQNSRVKDLIDMFLFIDRTNIDIKNLHDAINSTFKRRKTHEVPSALEYPPVSWKTRFEKLVEECNMSENLDSAFSRVNQFYKTLWENND